ncbi:MAG: AAA family ATPase [bacterium]
MRLSRIEIQGFKSFRDRMTIELSEGMTAIVGPNGCGKSNVVDALKWAMGDMSPKSLRGQEMQDVIFAGSETAKPMGMADVTLTFLNDGSISEDALGDALPREFRDVAEIGITRRLHRSGESEYLINKVPCRLLDIQNLLAGTGLGKQGYSIIEQNQVGFIVSARPSERRLLIEEASGITRYKGQRDRTVKRLEKADENLQRVADILAEVDKQIRSLERQAQRAGQYRRLADELKSLEVGVLLLKREELLAKRQRLELELHAATEERDRAGHALEQHEKALESGRVDLFAAEKKQTEETEAFYRSEAKLNLAKSKRDYAVQSMAEAQRRLETATREVTSQTERRQRLARELEGVRGELEKVAATHEAQQDVREQEEILRTAREAAVASDLEVKRARASFDQQRAEFMRAEDREQWLNNQRLELDAREAEHGQVLEQLSADSMRWRQRLADANERLAQSRAQAEERRVLVEAAQRTLDEAAQRAGEQRRVYREAHQRALDAATRLESLSALTERGEGFDDGVQAVMDWARANHREDVLGPLGNLVELPAAHVDAIGRAVGEQLAEVLVTSRQTAIEAHRGAKAKGRVVFRVVEDDFDPQKWVDRLVASLDFAKDLRDVGVDPSIQIWVLDTGELVLSDGRVIVGASVGNVEALVRRQEQVRSLKRDLPNLQEQAERAASALAVVDEQVAEGERVLQAARREHDESRVAFGAAAKEVESDAREVERVEKSLERHRSQLVPILRRRQEMDEELERIATRKLDFEQVRDALVSQLRDLEALAAERQSAAEALHAQLTEKRVELAQSLERRRNLEESALRLDRSLGSTEALIERYSKETDEAREKIAELEIVLSSGVDLAEIDADVARRREAMELSKERSQRAHQAVKELEAGSRERRARLDAAVARVQANEVAHREVDLSVAHVDEQLRDGFNLTPADAVLLRDQIAIPVDEWISRRDYLKRRIEGLGPVNAMAEDEYQEALERQTFLATQKEDLERSASDLRKAIAEMDRESRRRFRETFEAVNEKFQTIFPRLFRGGHARLMLTDPDDMLTTGVDIEVSPPGKRLQNVSLLSGGEKALTAVSLIFSIFLLKPTPFSVLDEVDAPLDEANVGRFSQMVREMSQTSQMIVITHSRRTMESAELLYGVTMEQPGVSKIVSVRLSEDDSTDTGRVA